MLRKFLSLATLVLGFASTPLSASSFNCDFRYRNCTLSCNDDATCWDQCRVEFEQCSAQPVPGQNFIDPTVDGERVDLCLEWAAQCGKPAADAFCRQSGFRRSTSFSVAENIGRTRLITGAICNDWFCDGFKNIQCL